MIITPTVGYLVVESVEINDKSGSGLIIPTKTIAYKVVSNNDLDFPGNSIVILGGVDKISKLEVRGRTFIIVPTTAVWATVTESA